MNAIVIVDENWSIGDGDRCVANISEDRRFFKNITLGKPIIMGRKTFETLPNNAPLPGRLNVVLTRNMNWRYDKSTENLRVFHSVENIFKEINTDDAWIIGGEDIYRLLLDSCERVYVTKVIDKIPRMSKHFPNLDNLDTWKLIGKGNLRYHNKMKYVFLEYMNTQFSKKHQDRGNRLPVIIYDDIFNR